jgi:putative transposase
LIVAGVRADGHREILAVDVADTESEATYHQLFRALNVRGLLGVRLVTSDDHNGLKAAIDRHFQGASWQRCQVHFAREMVKLVGAGRRTELAGDLREIFAATTREQAMTLAVAVAARWETSHPVVARLIEEGVEDCLACLAFPLAHRPRIRTTNGLERLNEEIKRRTWVVRIFPNADACLRLVTALCVEQSEEWVSGRRYLDMDDLLASDDAHGDGTGIPLVL